MVRGGNKGNIWHQTVLELGFGPHPKKVGNKKDPWGTFKPLLLEKVKSTIPTYNLLKMGTQSQKEMK